jgi:RNA polymerase sigma factor (sigma-70 family)
MSVYKQSTSGPDMRIEAAHFRQAQAGCRESLNHLMAAHEGLVHAVVRRQVLAELPFAQALQTGRIGLWQAILGYDPSYGTAFSSYAWPCIMRQVWRAVKAHARFQAVRPTVASRPAVEAGDPVTVYEAHMVRRALYALVGRLPARLGYIVMCRYGLDGPAATYRHIGARLGLSGERARQLHTEALVWLRHPAHSQHLRSLLGRHTLADYQATEIQAQRWLWQRAGRHEG